MNHDRTNSVQPGDIAYARTYKGGPPIPFVIDSLEGDMVKGRISAEIIKVMPQVLAELRRNNINVDDMSGEVVEMSVEMIQSFRKALINHAN